METESLIALIKNMQQLKSVERYNLRLMQLEFGNKLFYKFCAQKFEQFPIANVYKKEKDSFLRPLKRSL